MTTQSPYPADLSYFMLAKSFPTRAFWFVLGVAALPIMPITLIAIFTDGTIHYPLEFLGVPYLIIGACRGMLVAIVNMLDRLSRPQEDDMSLIDIARNLHGIVTLQPLQRGVVIIISWSLAWPVIEIWIQGRFFQTMKTYLNNPIIRRNINILLDDQYKG